MREVGETADDGRERAGEVGVGEVDGSDGGGGGGVFIVARDAVPPTRRSVLGVPGGEGGVWVVERELDLLEDEAFLV